MKFVDRGLKEKISVSEKTLENIKPLQEKGKRIDDELKQHKSKAAESNRHEMDAENNKIQPKY